jgi:glutathione S-transferase
VIDYHLNKTGKQYLLGDKVCYADLMFIPWNTFGPMIVDNFDWQKEYPKCYEWHQKLTSRPAVKKVLEDKAKASGH